MLLPSRPQTPQLQASDLFLILHQSSQKTAIPQKSRPSPNLKPLSLSVWRTSLHSLTIANQPTLVSLLCLCTLLLRVPTDFTRLNVYTRTYRPADSLARNERKMVARRWLIYTCLCLLWQPVYTAAIYCSLSFSQLSAICKSAGEQRESESRLGRSFSYTYRLVSLSLSRALRDPFLSRERGISKYKHIRVYRGRLVARWTSPVRWVLPWLQSWGSPTCREAANAWVVG